MAANAISNGHARTPKMEFVTVRVSRLAQTVLRGDLEEHFLDTDPNCRPKVSPPVPSFDVDFQTTTVTFLLETNRKARTSKLQSLREKQFKDSQGVISRPIFSEEWRGVTPLAQTNEDPAVDIIFVHGLGGHPYKTFLYKSGSDQAGCMWGQELLPEDLRRHGHFVRVSTYGYKASIAKEQGEDTPLSVTAEELLQDVARSRSSGCKRPLIFICHSLGGLVVCQAALEIMADHNSTHIPLDLKEAFCPARTGLLIKGIVFFGTPFKGSLLADLFGPLVSLFSSRIKRLQRKDEDRNTMLLQFDKLRIRASNNFPLLIFYEKKPLKKLMFTAMVTKRDAAVGFFTRNVERTPINKDHREMCRFPGNNDEEYSEKIAPSILRCLEKASTGPRYVEKDIAEFYEYNQEPYVRTEVARGGLEHAVRSIDRRERRLDDKIPQASAAAVRKSLRLIDFSSTFGHDRPALSETCDWVLEKESFIKWVRTDRHSLLFIRGSQGLGKSVLSGFIVNHLTSHQPEGLVFIVRFACNIAGRHSSPALILQHVLYHMCGELFTQIQDCADHQTQMFGSVLDFGFYWSLFDRLISAAEFKLFCIIDGLDQSISGGKRSGIYDEMKKFIDNICSRLTQNDEETSSQVKFLFTTRPLPEVAQLVERIPRIALDIQTADLIPGVGKMIDADVGRLAADKRLSFEIEEEIKRQIKGKAGPMFQWAHAVIQMLRPLTFSIDAFQEYKSRLDRFRPDNIDDPYLETLRDIDEDPCITSPDKRMLADVLRLVVFAESELKLSDLEYALALSNPESKTDDLQRYAPMALSNRLQISCGALIVMEGDKVKLAHQSVREFLTERVPADLSMFSCKDSHANNIFMVKCCLKCIRFMRDQDLANLTTPSALTLRKKLYDFVQNPFIWYSAAFWWQHVERLEDLDDIWPDLLRFLREPTEFRLMQVVQQHHLFSGQKEHTVFHTTSSFLACYNLYAVVKECKFGQYIKRPNRRSWIRNNRSWKEELYLDVEERSSDGSTMLHYAAYTGSMDLLMLLLKNGARGDVWNSRGVTPFMFAILNNHESVALKLMEHGQDHSAHHFPINTIQLAASQGLLQLLKKMLDKGADVNDNKGYKNLTPLHLIIIYEHNEAADFLLDRGADPLIMSRDGDSALHSAVAQGNISVLKAIFKKRPALDSNPTNKGGLTPLHMAAMKGNLEIFLNLFAKSLDVSPSNSGWLPVHYAASSGSVAILQAIPSDQLSTRTRYEETPLFIAAANGHCETVKYLISQGVDINARAMNHGAKRDAPSEQIYNVTPIIVALNENHSKVCEILIQKGADMDGSGSHGATMVHEAARSGNLGLLNHLIQSGQGPFVKNDLGNTALHLAAQNGRANIVSVILQQYRGDMKLQIDGKNHAGLTAFHSAVASGSTEVMNLLRTSGANPYHTPGFYPSALFLACYAQHSAALENLLSSDLDKDARDRYGESLIHYACHLGCLEMLDILVEHGKKINDRSILGRTPIMNAMLGKKVSIFDRLVQLGADLNVQDSRGLSIFDYVHEGHPFWLRVQSAERIKPAMNDLDRSSHIRKNLQVALSHIGGLPSLSSYYEYLDYDFLAFFTLHMTSEPVSTTKILLETGLTKLHVGRAESEIECSGCEAYRLDRPLHVCRSCHSHMLCHRCYGNHLYELRFNKDDGCPASHEYLTYGDDEWWDLPKGVVNAEGDTMDRWMEKFKARILDDGSES